MLLGLLLRSWYKLWLVLPVREHRLILEVIIVYLLLRDLLKHLLRIIRLHNIILGNLLRGIISLWLASLIHPWSIIILKLSLLIRLLWYHIINLCRFWSEWLHCRLKGLFKLWIFIIDLRDTFGTLIKRNVIWLWNIWVHIWVQWWSWSWLNLSKLGSKHSIRLINLSLRHKTWISSKRDLHTLRIWNLWHVH